MNRVGKVAVAVAALVLGITSFQLVLMYYEPGSGGGGEPGGPAVRPPSTQAQAQATRRSTPPGLPGGAKPLIRDGAPAPAIGKQGPPAVTPAAETELLPETTGDQADDAEIWRNPERPERSLIVADNKADVGGVAVYDLNGKMVHYERTGKIGNIDLRDGVRISGRTLTLVAANDRSNNTLRLWSLDHERGTLASLEAKPLPTLRNNYGLCLGRTQDGKHLYAFISEEGTGPNETGGGAMEQYELRATAAGKINAVKVRTVNVGSQSEGCVVDDKTGSLFVAQEDVGIWRYDLDPAGGARRTEIDRVGKGHLTADVEGITAARGPEGDGVLIASSQGDSTFAVYDLDGSHAYRGSFQVRGSNTSDGASETDGVAMAAGDFGDTYPNGLLVVHDAENHDSNDQDERVSNLKLVRLDQVIALTPTS